MKTAGAKKVTRRMVRGKEEPPKEIDKEIMERFRAPVNAILRSLTTKPIQVLV
jgi:hypothetical protein